MIMNIRDNICSHYNDINDMFSGKGENVAQSNVEAKALALKGCLRLPHMQT